MVAECNSKCHVVIVIDSFFVDSFFHFINLHFNCKSQQKKNVFVSVGID